MIDPIQMSKKIRRWKRTHTLTYPRILLSSSCPPSPEICNPFETKWLWQAISWFLRMQSSSSQLSLTLLRQAINWDCLSSHRARNCHSLNLPRIQSWFCFFLLLAILRATSAPVCDSQTIHPSADFLFLFLAHGSLIFFFVLHSTFRDMI